MGKLAVPIKVVLKTIQGNGDLDVNGHQEARSSKGHITSAKETHPILRFRELLYLGGYPFCCQPVLMSALSVYFSIRVTEPTSRRATGTSSCS